MSTKVPKQGTMTDLKAKVFSAQRRTVKKRAADEIRSETGKIIFIKGPAIIWG
jgi:hypothetical protein